jgi:hypothetical protein
MKCILAVRSEMKIKFGCQGFAASHVQELWQVIVKKSEVLVTFNSVLKAWSLAVF